jgi:CHAT domain-containing protein
MARCLGVLTLVFMLALLGCLIPDGLPISLSSGARAKVYEAVYMHQHAVRLYEQGNAHDAILVAEKAVEILEGALGSTHEHVAIPIYSLAIFYHTQGAFAKAEPFYVRALAILENKLGPVDPALPQHLDQLASLYRDWGAYGKAEPLYIRALAIRQRALGPTHPDVVENLNNLALTFEKEGEYRKAEPLYTSALAIAERRLGPNDPDVARGLDGLAMLYCAQGEYARAEPLLARALEIRQKSLEKVRRIGAMGLIKGSNFLDRPQYHKDPSRNSRVDVALSGVLGSYASGLAEVNYNALRGLSNLDRLYSATGTYGKSEPLVTRTADVFERVEASAKSEVSQSLGSLARLYMAKGEYKRAEPLLVQALDARAGTPGAATPDVASSLNNLAQLYQTQGAYAKAEPLLLRVLDIRKQALGEMHPDVARSLNNLALLYEIQGAYAKAEPLLIRAVTILETTLGGMHADVARSLNNLALLYHDQGAYTKAEPLYVRAVDIISKAPGAMHPDAVRYLNNLGVLYHASGVPAKAEPLMARAAELRESQLHLELARLSEPRKRALVTLLQQETESLVSLHADSAPASAPALELALTTVLRRKGVALESLLDNQATLRAHLTPGILAKLDQLAAANTELSTALRVRMKPRMADAHASAIAALRTRIDALESELNAAGSAYHARAQPVTPAEIQAVLPYGTALIEFVRYRRFDPRQDLQRWQEARYVAYVLQWKGPPRWVALGEAEPIDAGVDAVLAEMRPNARVDETKAALQHLDALLFAPIRDRLEQDVSHVILSPDGKLNLVPFEALLDSKGRYELEGRLLSYVTSGRDLLQLAVRRTPRSPATIVAAPDYGPGRAFTPLDGVSSEAIEVSAHLPGARMLIGGQATKAALATIVGPAVLHVATHGFYARDAMAPSAPLAAPDLLERDMFIEGGASPAGSSALGDPTEALDRAGLALANANTRPDGIVTAREIANYDWWGTQLVVLSACETGVGAVRSGDGMYGLRRALALAGAESQVVSLWNVGDSSARALMGDYYGELAGGAGRAEALRQAKLHLMRQPRYAHPYYWAAFIPAGDWRPLDKMIFSPPEPKP